MAEVGKRIRELRRMAGKTQEEVARALGVSKSTVSKWEKGERTPSLGTLERICSLFRVKIDALLSTAQSEKAFGGPGQDKVSVESTLAFWLDRVSDILDVVKDSKELSSLWSKVPLSYYPIEALSDPQRMDTIVAEADRMRSRIGRIWADGIEDFSRCIEKEGNVFVFRLPLPQGVSGVSTRHQNVSLVFASTLEAVERQKFIICREMAHLLFHVPGEGGTHVSLPGRKSKKEEEADAFASRLLISDDILRIFRRQKAPAVLKIVNVLETLTLVPSVVYLSRALEGFISRKTYTWCKKQLLPYKPGRGETVLSPKFEQMVLKALVTGKISLKEASVLLDQDCEAVKGRMLVSAGYCLTKDKTKS